MDPYSSQNLQKYIQYELFADDQLKKSRCLDVLLATKNVLRFNINKSSKQENDNHLYA